MNNIETKIYLSKHNPSAIECVAAFASYFNHVCTFRLPFIPNCINRFVPNETLLSTLHMEQPGPLDSSTSSCWYILIESIQYFTCLDSMQLRLISVTNELNLWRMKMKRICGLFCVWWPLFQINAPWLFICFPFFLIHNSATFHWIEVVISSGKNSWNSDSSVY